MDMGYGVFIVSIIVCSQFAIGHRSNTRDLKHWWEWERNSTELDAPIKRADWRINHPIDSNEYVKFEPDSSEENSQQWSGDHPGSYHGHHGGYHSRHGHHGHHGRYPDWEANSRTVAKPKRRPVNKPSHKLTHGPTFKPYSKSTFRPTSVPTEEAVLRTSTTTKTIRITTFKPDSAVTMPQNIQICLRSCPVTSEYNPVCGTNNMTYNNPGRLICAKKCGVDVGLWKQSICTNEGVDSDTSADITPESIDEWDGTNSPSPNITQCIRNCPIPTDYEPVCGTDDVTYNNSEHLICAQLCGLDVKPKKIAACSSAEGRTIPLPSAIQLCVNICPSSSVNSPVCGSNGVTYKNSMQLLCHRICGVDVQAVPCPTNSNNNGFVNAPVPPPVVNNSSLKFVVEDCINLCPQTSEYNPICGTNNVTYRNPGHLGCAQTCGVNVEIKRKSACAHPINTTETPGTVATISIIGNKEDATTESGRNGFNLTIPPDVLNAIFNDETTTESDVFDIDPRFQDK